MSHKRAKIIRKTFGLRHQPQGEFRPGYLKGRGPCLFWIPSGFRRRYQKCKRQFKTNQDFRHWMAWP